VLGLVHTGVHERGKFPRVEAVSMDVDAHQVLMM
jgi:hypothetical protein